LDQADGITYSIDRANSSLTDENFSRGTLQDIVELRVGHLPILTAYRWNELKE
jgi:hypothetical protein